jgi:hypothetical protein
LQNALLTPKLAQKQLSHDDCPAAEPKIEAASEAEGAQG